LVQQKEKKEESDRSRSSVKAGLEAQDRRKPKDAHLKNTRKIRKYNKLMFTREIFRTMQMNMKQVNVGGK
jgi:hypothetical protein